jgi:Sensory domain in DIguanylate Cyclases and Two-component system
MICRTSEEKRSEKLFRSRLRPYLKIKNSRSLPTSRKARANHGSEIAVLPTADVTHLFNHEAMLAASHAIEDLARDTGCGELIATFQRMDNFAPQKDRYLRIAEEIDAVRVWAEGEPIYRESSIDFVPIFHPLLARYWVVLFESPDVHAVLFCKQANDAGEFARKIFSGFYSFNPFLVRCIRRRFSLLSAGVDGVVAHFERNFAPLMPDQDSLADVDALLTPA